MMVTKLLRRPFALFAIVALTLCAAPGFAATMLFGEVLTSNQSLLGSNLRATIEAGDLNADPGDIMLDGSIVAGAGIGDGRVSGLHDYVLFTHTFSPSMPVASVTSAQLTVALRDDSLFDARESASIELNGEFWRAGSASWIQLFGGDITALFANNEDQLTVAVISRGGDFIVDTSLMIWTYETDGDGVSAGGAAPVPEPTGLALFCVGAVVLRRATRRQG